MHRSNKRRLEQTFNELYPRLVRYAAWRLPTREAAEDVVAEVFFQALKHAEGYDAARGDFAGWVFGIARHRIADYWRRHRTEPMGDEYIEQLPDTKTDLVERTDYRLRFDGIMRSLPEHLSALLTLRHVDGHSHEEIAEIVGKSPDAVRQTLSRLHRNLHALFPHYDIRD